MPDFENFRKAVLCQGEPDRVPQFDGTVAAEHKQRLLGRPVADLADEVAFCMKAGYDFVPLTIGFRQTMRGEMSGIMGDRAVETSILKPKTAQYNLFEKGETTRMWAEEGTGVVRDEATFEAFPWPDADTDFRYDTVTRLGKLLPDGAKAIVNVGYVFTAPWMMMGLERFCLALAEGDPLVARTIERVGQTQRQVVENLLQFDCIGAVRMPDDLAHTGGTMVSPKFLRQHVFPWYLEIGKLVRAKGLPYLLHSDGRLYEVLDDLLACGFQAIHPCEPASMDIDRLKRQYGGRLCLMGNIDLDYTLTLGTPEQVVDEVKRRIRTIAPGGGFCCGSSNSVPEYVPFENYLAMITAIQEHGRYPIRLAE